MTNIEIEITKKANEACKKHDGSANYRYGYYDGAKWMQERMIEKAEKWLRKNINEDVSVPCGNVIKIISADEFVEYFIKSMEE